MQLVETDPDTVGSVGLLEDKCSLALTQMLRTFFVTLLYILVIIIFMSFFLGHLDHRIIHTYVFLAALVLSYPWIPHLMCDMSQSEEEERALMSVGHTVPSS